MSDGRDEEVLSVAEAERLMAEVDASLETAMRVEPSADFLARVRLRIADESARAPVPWPDWWWRVAAPGLAVLAVVGAALVGREAGVGEPGPAPARSAASAARPAPPPSTNPAPSLSARRQRSVRRSAPASAARIPVLVEAGQLEALARMAARARPDASLPFAVESLEEAPLPELRAGELPRFEAKRLTVRWGGWQEQDEGSGS
jgi:hypothetical protein